MVFWHRKDQLARWDLRVDPLPPDGRLAAVYLSGAAGAAAVGFAVVNWLTPNVDGWQKLQNIFVWTVASTVAASVGIFLGQMLAERGYQRKGD